MKLEDQMFTAIIGLATSMLASITVVISIEDVNFNIPYLVLMYATATILIIFTLQKVDKWHKKKIRVSSQS